MNIHSRLRLKLFIHLWFHQTTWRLIAFGRKQNVNNNIITPLTVGNAMVIHLVVDEIFQKNLLNNRYEHMKVVVRFSPTW